MAIEFRAKVVEYESSNERRIELNTPKITVYNNTLDHHNLNIPIMNISRAYLRQFYSSHNIGFKVGLTRLTNNSECHVIMIMNSFPYPERPLTDLGYL